MYVIAGVEEAPDTLIWLSSDTVNQAVLEAVPTTDGASPAPSGSGAPSGSQSAAPSS